MAHVRCSCRPAAVVRAVLPGGEEVGSWELTIARETRKRAVNRFVVTTGDPPEREIRIALP